MSKTWISVSVGLFVLFSLVAWRFQTKSSEAAQLQKQQDARKSAPASVTVVTAGPRAIAQGLDLVGTIESPFVLKLSPKEAGKILTISVREGDPVVPGQILAQLDPTQLDAQVLQLQANLNEARFKLAQATATQASNDTGIETSIRQQVASASSSEAQYEQSKQTLAAKLQADQNTVVDAEARLRSANAQAEGAKTALNSAKASLVNAKAKAARQQKLYEEGYAALQDAQDAQTAVTVQENVVQAAQEGVNSAQSGVVSAQAQLDAAKQTASVNKKKLQADLVAAEALVDQSRAGVDAARANQANSAAYRENVSALKASVSNADAQLREIQSRRSDLALRSTIEGVVTDRAADPGDFASPGQAVLTVQFLKWIYVVVSAPVDKAPFIRVGQEVTLTFDAFPGQTFKAPVEKIDPAADPQSRQFKFLIRLENPDRRFRPGMFAKVHAVTARVAANVVVPREAVKNGTVFVLKDDGTLSQRPVTTGLEDAEGYEVLEGVQAGDKVVTLTYSPLKDGQKAKVSAPGAKK